MSTVPCPTPPQADGLVITASPMPLLLLDRDLAVIAASPSFCAGFDLDTAEVTGRPLEALGSGEWGTAHLRLLLAAVLIPASACMPASGR